LKKFSMSSAHEQGCDCSSGCRDSSSRRDFLKIAGLGAAAIAAGLPVMAGPFEAADFARVAPPDKKLDPQWLRSLFARGARTVYRGAELEKIGMPIGGICTGQVYLGGDGRLWHWDIFNTRISTAGEHYAAPLKPAAPFKQGFAVRIGSGEKAVVRVLDSRGFADISFRGEYPIGLVEYRDPECPVSVSLEAFSPFVPLDPHDSHLPATILQFTVKNASQGRVECELAGWLENGACIHSAGMSRGTRTNAIVRRKGITALNCTATPLATSGQPAPPPIAFADFGSLSLALLAARPDDLAYAAISAEALPQNLFHDNGVSSDSATTKSFPSQITGALARKLSLEPGQQATTTFVVAWHFPNILHLGLKDIEGRQYGKRFASALAVAEHVAANFAELVRQTRLWRDTWYDSTLPYWFLDRTFANTSTLATSTAYWFSNDRFYGWEGVGCCPGTCTHVWQYAQAVARVFPSLERTAREMVDYGVGFHADTGTIGLRAEFDQTVAVDGQAGTIVRAYREHQMSTDDAFLNRNWPKIKKSLSFLIDRDGNRDGILDGPQPNTLDCEWFGKVAWLSSLYVAALRAGEQMALEMGDEAFARQARALAELGTENIDRQLFNGEYYIQIGDQAHAKSIGSYDGCEIDQVFGQSWAFQVGLERILPREHTLSALRSLWKYNFTPDVGPFRKANPAGRWFAMAGEGGLLMGSWPRGDQKRVTESFDAYFNECMSGFEYQVAGHMIWEGMVQEGLAIVRAIHDRYHASRRNPWNEVECGDHYARAMASYGVFLAACGFQYHGPKGYMAFAPRLTPEDFRAAFTSAEGWGTFSQKREGRTQRETIAIRWGQLRLKTLAFALPENIKPKNATVTVKDQPVASSFVVDDGRITISLAANVVVKAGRQVEIVIT
jgi:non-lysosomal glucosylceramidase